MEFRVLMAGTQAQRLFYLQHGIPVPDWMQEIVLCFSRKAAVTLLGDTRLKAASGREGARYLETMEQRERSAKRDFCPGEQLHADHELTNSGRFRDPGV